jgi:cell division septation protein DedD
VASSKDTEATQYLVKRLKKKGYPAFSTLKEVPEKGVWHRIRVGPFPDRKAAEEMLARLKADNLNAYIVRP